MASPKLDLKELNFLILKYLESSLGNEVSKVVENEFLKHQDALPARFDWTGKKVALSYVDLKERYPHVPSGHLVLLLERLLTLSNGVSPFPSSAWTLLGQDGFSIIEHKENEKENGIDKGENTSLSHRRSDAPMESWVQMIQKLSPSRYLPCVHRKIQGSSSSQSLRALQLGDRIPRSFRPHIAHYSKFRHLTTIQGHEYPIYCIIFDRSGKRMITGSDDRMVKVWSSQTGQLLHTLRGHCGDITDLAIDESNSILASASNDNVIRLWDMKTFHPIGVLIGHHKPITAVQFCPNPTEKLLLTASQGGVRLWFADDLSKPPIYLESGGQHWCASFSPGGQRFITGGSDGCARIWSLDPPRLYQTLRGHRNVPLNTVSWCHYGSKIITGCHDGTARIWDWVPNKARWECIFVLPHDRLLNQKTETPTQLDSSDSESVKCTMVCWSLNDDYVITAFSNSQIKVWDSKTGNLVFILKGHTKEVYILDTHPHDERVIMSGGYDGRVILWSLEDGNPIRIFDEGTHNLQTVIFLKMVSFLQCLTKTVSSQYSVREREKSYQRHRRHNFF
eukprot:TRINITY_DN603_c0_g1_i6.p1 TRINITY_DN603_c0_g1~~TRINITY_DN603_c0_g1_i6.p1  ORF type:complete len:563 (+),score=39.81 TRINITY_DN603_c0_g1_i6:86-1774(+)